MSSTPRSQARWMMPSRSGESKNEGKIVRMSIRIRSSASCGVRAATSACYGAAEPPCAIEEDLRQQRSTDLIRRASRSTASTNCSMKGTSTSPRGPRTTSSRRSSPVSSTWCTVPSALALLGLHGHAGQIVEPDLAGRQRRQVRLAHAQPPAAQRLGGRAVGDPFEQQEVALLVHPGPEDAPRARGMPGASSSTRRPGAEAPGVVGERVDDDLAADAVHRGDEPHRDEVPAGVDLI